MANSGANGKGALDGIRVIDLTRVLGGPYCTQILGDHGADVIKVEPPQGDEVRDWGPPFRDGTASYYVGINRTKRAVALDLSRPDGRDVLLRLLDGADVLIHNFKSGALERWGMGYEDVLRERFPRLVLCHITGFGGDGPLGGLPGYDAAVQAHAGTMSTNGAPESGPVRTGTPIIDLGTGLNAVIGILLALYERERSGLGQSIEVTLYDTAVALSHPHAANYLMSGKVPQASGNAHPNISPYDAFRTRTGLIFLAVGNDAQFRRLGELLGEPGLADDPRFRSNGDRVVNRGALGAELERLMADEDCEELAGRLMRANVPAGAVLNVAQVLEGEHVRHRGGGHDARGVRASRRERACQPLGRGNGFRLTQELIGIGQAGRDLCQVRREDRENCHHDTRVGGGAASDGIADAAPYGPGVDDGRLPNLRDPGPKDPPAEDNQGGGQDDHDEGRRDDHADRAGQPQPAGGREEREEQGQQTDEDGDRTRGDRFGGARDRLRHGRAPIRLSAQLVAVARDEKQGIVGSCAEDEDRKDADRRLVPRDINRGERAGGQDAGQLVGHADNGERDEPQYGAAVGDHQQDGDDRGGGEQKTHIRPVEDGGEIGLDGCGAGDLDGQPCG